MIWVDVPFVFSCTSFAFNLLVLKSFTCKIMNALWRPFPKSHLSSIFISEQERHYISLKDKHVRKNPSFYKVQYHYYNFLMVWIVGSLKFEPNKLQHICEFQIRVLFIKPNSVSYYLQTNLMCYVLSSI